MGSIADLLGDQLRAGLAQLVDPEAPDEAPGEAPASAQERASDACERARMIAMEAVLEEVARLASDPKTLFVTLVPIPDIPTTKYLRLVYTLLQAPM